MMRKKFGLITQSAQKLPIGTQKASGCFYRFGFIFVCVCFEIDFVCAS